MSADTAISSLQSIVGSVREKTETLDLLIYWRSIARRKWAILGLAFTIAVITAVLVNTMTPIYRSTVTLLIEQNKAKIAPTEEVYASVGDTREHFQTQAEILKARALAVRLVEKLDLTKHKDFDPRQQPPSLLDRLRKQLGFPAEEPKWTEEALEKAAVGSLMARMTVEPVRLSQLIHVSFESSDPVIAAQIANAIAESYIQADM